MRVILDTSVVVSGHISRNGTPAEILLRWQASAFTLLITKEILNEWIEVLNRAWIIERLTHAPDRIQNFLNAVISYGEPVPGYTNVAGLVRDPFDEMFLACARLGRADVLVSVDKDLLALGTFEDTKIVRPSAFLAMLEK